MPHDVASDLGLHCLHKFIYEIIFFQVVQKDILIKYCANFQTHCLTRKASRELDNHYTPTICNCDLELGPTRLKCQLVPDRFIINISVVSSKSVHKTVLTP